MEQRPGGRSARVRDAVRQATLAELAEHGYGGLTVENVAIRSGVHKTTVYRRWGNVEGLIADALELAREEPWPMPDTGSFQEDLREIVRLVQSGFADPVAGPVSAAFVTAA
ncbi:TetR/AcrR family transcriptional regulator, partial [Streptosporangium algeriense]